MDDGAALNISMAAIAKYFLVLIRCGVMFSVFPVLSAKQIPNQIKFALSAMIAFVVCATLPNIAVPRTLIEFAIAIIAQALVGLTIGMVSVFIFAGIQFAGEIIDTQVGFAVTNIINPLNSTSVTVLGQFEIVITTLIFLATDSHHLLIEGMAGSFQIVPLPYADVSPGLMVHVGELFAASLGLVFKIAIPIAVALLITNISMGFLARVAPQVNVFMVAFPAQLGIGMLMFALTLPLLAYVLPVVFSNMPRQMDELLRFLAPHR